MTHDTQGKRWPPTAGAEADFITVDTRGAGSAAATRLRLYGIPHSTVYACKPPVLEGWSFSVYNGAEEHASGWGSTTLADMAPALLAAVGMTDAATAHKRAQVAETRAIDLAGERDAAVEALDIANDMIGKLCTEMAGAGFTGDLLVGVQHLIKQRDAAEQERKDLSAILKRWEDFVRGYLPTVTLATNTADRHFDLRVALGDDVIYALKREVSAAQSERDTAKRELATAQMQLRDISRVLGPRRGDESVVAQAERARKILDRWQDLAIAHLAACPQVSFTQAVPDLGSRHFALRGYMEGEINALRSRLSLAAEREDLTIVALGHPCSTNGIPEAVGLLRRDAERWLTECGEVGARAAALSAENAAVRKALETPEGVSLTDHAAEIVRREAKMREVFEARNHVTTELDAWRELGAVLTGLDAHKATNDELREAVDTKVCGDSHEIARLRGSLNARATGDALALTKPLRVAMGWAERRDLNAERVVEAAVVAVTHSVAMSKEVTRLNAALENTGGYGARERVKTLTRENEELRRDAAAVAAERDRLMHALRQQNTVAAVILAGTREALETPKDANVVEHAAQVLRRAKALDAWQTWGLRAACVVAAGDDTLRSEIDKALPMWRRGAPTV